LVEDVEEKLKTEGCAERRQIEGMKAQKREKAACGDWPINGRLRELRPHTREQRIVRIRID